MSTLERIEDLSDQTFDPYLADECRTPPESGHSAHPVDPEPWGNGRVCEQSKHWIPGPGGLPLWSPAAERSTSQVKPSAASRAARARAAGSAGK